MEARLTLKKSAALSLTANVVISNKNMLSKYLYIQNVHPHNRMAILTQVNRRRLFQGNGMRISSPNVTIMSKSIL